MNGRSFDDFRESSIRAAEEFFERAREQLAGAVADGVASARDRTDQVRSYLRSEELEKDLDALASRLGVTFPEERIEDRDRRVHAKIVAILEQARDEVLRAAEVGGALGLLFRRSRAMAVVALVAGGVKIGEIGYEAFRIFVSKRGFSGRHRPVGLRIVE